MYGWSEDEALLMNASDRIPEALRKKELAKMVNLGKGKIMKPYRTQRLTKKEIIVEVWIMATALINETGQMYAVATTERVNEAHT